MTQDARQEPTRRRYRKIEVRMWGDEKFGKLSPIPPCGQGLWIFLLTGPHTGPIPGLFRSGRAAMAEELDWDMEAFEEAFGEAFRQGMVKADWKAKLVWIPKAITCNKPESPNVVLSWGSEWDLIPECDLKREAYEMLRANIHALGESYAKAFDKAFGKPSVEPIDKPIGKTSRNQEQEQEQEERYSSEQFSLEAGHVPEPAERVVEHLPLVDGSKFPVTESHFAELTRAYPGVNIQAELRRMVVWLDANPRKRKTARGVKAFVVTWLTRKQDQPRYSGGNSVSDDSPWAGAK